MVLVGTPWEPEPEGREEEAQGGTENLKVDGVPVLDLEVDWGMVERNTAGWLLEPAPVVGGRSNSVVPRIRKPPPSSISQVGPIWAPRDGLVTTGGEEFFLR